RANRKTKNTADQEGDAANMATTPTTPAPDTPAPVFPRLVYQPSAAPPGYKSLSVASQEDLDALKPPAFDTPQLAATYQLPIEQPIPHIARTTNEEQFDPRKSAAGRDVETDVLQTPPPVTNVYIRTGVNPEDGALSAELPKGLDAGTLLGRAPGKVF